MSQKQSSEDEEEWHYVPYQEPSIQITVEEFKVLASVLLKILSALREDAIEHIGVPSIFLEEIINLDSDVENISYE